MALASRKIGDVIRGLVPRVAIGHAVLFVGPAHDCPPEAVCWSRDRAPWPPEGPFGAAILMLPLDKSAYEMSLHAIAARLPQGAPLIVYGPNNEGIKSAAKAFPPFFEKAEVLLAKAHARVWQAARSAVTEGLGGRLADWRRTTALTLNGRSYDWLSYPGVFAKGGLDVGTGLLLRQLPAVKGQSALDFGAGTGVIARVLVDLGAHVSMVESDAIALEAARANVPEATAILGRDLPAERFDIIVSNPPIHQGRSRDLAVLTALIADAPRRLRKGGLLFLVTQKTVPLPRLAQGHLRNVECLADEAGYRVWKLN